MLDSSILLETNFANLEPFLTKHQKGQLFYLIDENVYKHYACLFASSKIVLMPSGEENKSINQALILVQKLLDMKITRGDTLVCVGGGVTLDIGGFIAGILYRGIKHIFVATTILAAVDASFGGKCGVDFDNSKNILGVFKNPAALYVSTKFFATLPEQERLSGLGEVIKYSFLRPNFEVDADLAVLIKNCLEIKSEYVQKDPYDQGARMELNLGHTFGHIIELQANIPHGIAVVNGIKLILDLEKDLHFEVAKLVAKLEYLCQKFGIILGQYDYKQYLDLIFKDKKNLAGTLNLVFINDDGPFLYPIKRGEIDV